MSPLLLAALSLQVQINAEIRRDSTDSSKKEVKVSVSAGTAETGREPRRIPVTEQHLRTAFKSPAARTLLERARTARLAQDSALQSYDATAYLRISAGMGFAKIGRDRLIFRTENVTNVRWHRDFGAWIEVKGARTVIPIAPEEAQGEAAEDISDESDMFTLPYHPGQEQLLSLKGTGIRTQVDERDIVHPLAGGSEAYYTYAVGDSVLFRLPAGETIRLRELQVRPRTSKWNLVVGSLWFDVATGQLVRAAYRLSVPMDIWAVAEEEEPGAKDEVPIWVRPLVSPMRAQISAIAVEYGLHRGRFWLPRLRSAEGDAQVSFMRAPFKFEQSFRYASVNAIETLPAIHVPERPRAPDSLSAEDREKWRDSVRASRRAKRKAQEDSIRDGLRAPVPRCDSAGMRTITRRESDDSTLKVAVRIPCDARALATSPELPKSIYDPGEEIFGSAERDALVQEALAMGAQPPFQPGAIPPTLKYGLQFTRYNRIEGLSTGLLVEQPLGGGYAAELFGRIGHADLEPNAELVLSRSNLTRSYRGRVFNRLVSAGDWGNPLSFGSSLSALLFGRDEGFYYRASGVELERLSERGEGAQLSWKLFLERQRTAAVENDFSLSGSFIPNIAARTGTFGGFATRVVHTRGQDPKRLRIFSDLRMEAALGDSASTAYGRAAMDITLSRAFGPIGGAATLGAGSAMGGSPLPAQRRWYLGGVHSIRGQPADTAYAGDAFWMARLEIGRSAQSLRPVLFGDIGWTGDRRQWREVGRPMSGLGVGASVMDGLIRLDLSRGIHPTERTRLDLYVEARW